jgi:glycosyltransferase involved in cell wall biosynthesis
MNASSPPTTSIVIPTYNRRALLEETLRSVLVQTRQDFEAIVVDDGSTDDTVAFLEALRDPRLRIARRPHCGHEGAARNVGLGLARGRFIALLDSDDLWEREKLERQIAYMEARPRAGLTFTNGVIFGAGPGVPGKVLLRGKGRIFTFEDLLGPPFVPTSSAILRADVVAATGLFDEDPRLRGVVDYQYWLRVAAGFEVHMIPDRLIRYRIHGDNMVGVQEHPLEAIATLLRGLGRYVPVGDRLLRRALRTHATVAAYLAAANPYRAYRRRLRELAAAVPDEAWLGLLNRGGPLPYLAFRLLRWWRRSRAVEVVAA